MMIRTHSISIDILNDSTNKTNIEFVTGDSNSNVLDISLLRCAEPLDISDVTRITLTFRRPDNVVIINDVSVVDAKAGKLTYTMKTNEISVGGLLAATLELYGDNGERLTSNKKLFSVRGQLDNVQSITKTNEYPVLTNLINEVTEAIRSEETRVSNEDTRIINENIRAESEDIRQQQEYTRQTNTAVVIENANTATSTANTAADNANTKASLAQSKAEIADSKATLADQKATLASNAASNADTKATLANNAATSANSAATNANNVANNIQVVWKTPVDNYAAITSTYTTPAIGWQVQTIDNGNVYRYSGTAWSYVYNTSVTPIKHYIWEEQKTVAVGGTFFTLTNTVTTGQKLLIYDTSYGAWWQEGINWNRSGQVVTVDALPVSLTFNVINLG